ATSCDHISSVIEGSSPGTRWLRTSFLSPAAAAIRPTSLVSVVSFEMVHQFCRIGEAIDQIHAGSVHGLWTRMSAPLANSARAGSRRCRPDHDRLGAEFEFEGKWSPLQTEAIVLLT